MPILMVLTSPSAEAASSVLPALSVPAAAVVSAAVVSLPDEDEHPARDPHSRVRAAARLTALISFDFYIIKCLQKYICFPAV